MGNEDAGALRETMWGSELVRYYSSTYCGPRLAKPLPIKMDWKTHTSIPFRKVIDSLV